MTGDPLARLRAVCEAARFGEAAYTGGQRVAAERALGSLWPELLAVVEAAEEQCADVGYAMDGNGGRSDRMIVRMCALHAAIRERLGDGDEGPPAEHG